MICVPGPWALQRPPAGVSVDRSHPLVRGAVNFWPGTEAGGSSLGDAIGGAPIVLSGVGWRPTPLGWVSPYFGPTSSAVVTPGSSVNPVTILVWVYLSPGGTGAILRRTLSQTAIMREGSMNVYGQGYSSAEENTIRVNFGTLTQNLWHCLVLTTHASNDVFAAWTDGAFVSADLADGLSLPNVIGGFGGCLGPLWYYRRVLSPDEIRLHYEQPFCMFEESP